MFGIRGFKIGRTVEASFEQYLNQAKQQPAQQQPNPEQIKAQAEVQAKQAEIQLEQAKLQAETQLENMKFQHESQIESQKLQFEQWKTQMDNDTKMAIAQLGMKQHVMSINAQKSQEGLVELTEMGDEVPNSALSALVDAVNQNMAQMIQVQNQSNQAVLERQHAMIEQMNKPKQVVRDQNGKIIGVQ